MIRSVGTDAEGRPVFGLTTRGVATIACILGAAIAGLLIGGFAILGNRNNAEGLKGQATIGCRDVAAIAGINADSLKAQIKTNRAVLPKLSFPGISHAELEGLVKAGEKREKRHLAVLRSVAHEACKSLPPGVGSEAADLQSKTSATKAHASAPRASLSAALGITSVSSGGITSTRPIQSPAPKSKGRVVRGPRGPRGRRGPSGETLPTGSTVPSSTPLNPASAPTASVAPGTSTQPAPTTTTAPSTPERQPEPEPKQEPKQERPKAGPLGLPCIELLGTPILCH